MGARLMLGAPRRTSWSDAELASDFESFKQFLALAPLSGETTKSYIRYTRYFLGWRTGDHVPRRMVVASGRNVPARAVDLVELRSQLDEYESFLLASPLERSGVPTYVGQVNPFLGYLAATYHPGGRQRPGAARTIPAEAPGARPSDVQRREGAVRVWSRSASAHVSGGVASRATGRSVAGAVPKPVRELVSRWHDLGSPAQEAMTWPQERWLASLPERAGILRALPPTLDRAAVRLECSAAYSDLDSATRGLVAVMAWGFGTRGYGPYRVRRILGFPGAAGRLVAAARILQEGALAAYRQMATSTGRLPFLGPAFGTKFLYFCQPAPSDRSALILDRFVADWLAREVEFTIDPWTWSPSAYGSYLDLMHGWAGAVGCAPDDLERLMFEVIAVERLSDWGRRRVGG